MRKHDSKAYALSAFAISLLSSTTVHAQAGPTVDELIVTALKRAENVQDVPASITAVGAEQLADRGVTQVSDLQYVAPSMQIGKLWGGTAVSIRAVGLNQGAPGVAVHVDGVYQPRPSMGDLSQVDLERVEVLRGPQGTLYGRNANGGAVNFITRAPTSEFEGYAQAAFGNYETIRLEAVSNIPVNEKIRSRLVLSYSTQGEGFVENLTPGGQDVDKSDSLSGRLRIAADLTEDLTLDLNLVALHGSGPSYYHTIYGSPTALARSRNPFLNAASYPTGPRTTTANDPYGTSRDYTSGAMTLNWDIGPAQIRSITGYQRLADQFTSDNDALNVSAFLLNRTDRSKTFTQEVNISGTLGPVDAVVGVYYLDENFYTRTHYHFPLGIAPFPPNTFLQFEAYKYLTRAGAVFSDATWNVTDRFRVIGGVRYSRETQKLTQRNFYTPGTAPTVFTCALQTNDVTFESTTPRLGAQYDLSDNANAYGSFSKGFKSGGFSTSTCNNQFNPERITAYEAGLKGRFFDRSVSASVSAFYYDYTDLQLSQIVGLSSIITNAAGAEIKGVETEATWNTTENWTLSGNATWLDARYTSFETVDGLEPAKGAQDVSGNRLNNAPKFAANAGVAYETDPFSFGTLTFRVDASYRSRVYFREFNQPLDSQAPYTTLNLAAIWDSPDSKYRVRVYGSNVTGEDVIARMSSSDNLGSRFVTWGAPRQFGIELRANY